MNNRNAKYGKRVFVSGKVSGIEYLEACKLFYDAAAIVLRRGFIPVIPVELCRSYWGWYRCMAKCLWYLFFCKYILQLDNWESSRGARVEYRFARFFGKRVLRIVDGKIKGL